MASTKKVFTLAFQLSSVSRFSRDYMQKPENLLEHIGFCVFYGAILAKSFEFTKEQNSDLFMRIAAHDLDEAFLGDIPRTTKYFNESIRNVFTEVELLSIKRLDAWLGTQFEDDWVYAKHGEVGDLLRLVDIAAVVYKNWTEIRLLGNRSFLRVCLETNKNLNAIDPVRFPKKMRDEFHALKQINESLISGVELKEEDSLFLQLIGGSENVN